MSRNRILVGDVLLRLAELPDESVHCVVTSPPYWGLRDFGTATWSGGDPACDHKWLAVSRRFTNGRGEGVEGDGYAGSNLTSWTSRDATPGSLAAACPRGCGAVRTDAQLGLEPTPQEYVARMVRVFREVRRVLRRDGTLWLNMGDCYATQPNSNREAALASSTLTDHGRTTYVAAPHRRWNASGDKPFTSIAGGLKPKDLAGMPWRLALALQADGWYLRRDIVWSKPNPMPESVRDRPTTAHEYLFLLSKSERYYYDAEAIAEPVREGTESRYAHGFGDRYQLVTDPGGYWGPFRGKLGPRPRHQAVPDGWMTGQGAHDTLEHSRRSADTLSTSAPVSRAVRNRRSVWTIPTQPYREAHFACVDEATECLTAEGWLRHDRLRPGMLAAEFDMERQKLSWSPVEDVARYDVVNQEMVVGRRRDLDMVLTPNHRCVIQRRHPQTRQHQAPAIVRADRLLPSHAVPSAAAWDWQGDTSIPLEWSELLGWYVAEGHECKQSLAVEIYQSATANPKKCERIEALLRQVGAEWTSARTDRIWRGTVGILVCYRITGYAAVRLRELAPQKRIPVAALLWSDERIEALVRGLVLGDGHTRLSDGRLSFIQKDEVQAGMVQALAIRLGYSATLSRLSDGICTVYITKHRTRSFRGTAGSGTPLDRQRYTGVVWCPKLPKGTWVARRNGRVFITGNTFPELLVEPCILAGTSERGVCATCGAPRWRESGRACAACGLLMPTQAKECPHCGDPWREERELNPALLATDFSIPDPGRAKLTADTVVGDVWRPGCPHTAATVPALVLDPFCGSGTTCAVAVRHDRDWLGIELNPAYVALAERRIAREARQMALPL